VKALDSPVVKVKYSPDASMLASVGQNGSIFFFELEHEKFDWLEPL